MLLIPRLKTDGSLTLKTYSYSAKEIGVVAAVLSDAEVRFSSQGLPADKRGRRSRGYVIEKADVSRLEMYLHVRFEGVEASTTVEFEEEVGQTYRCEELAVAGMGRGCVNLVARSGSEAKVKCAMIANARAWLGGVASPGRCKLD